jgi:pyruvate/2-oxoglutarate/acetoin dehydrogenase E1 component
MFGDFSALAADQIINSISKFEAMYNGTAKVPLVIRTPMGGRRGYGPTHGQTLEKLYLGIPGLRTVAVNALADPGELLKAAILQDDGPVFFIENKVLYPRQVLTAEALSEFDVRVSKNGYTPTHTLKIKGAPAPAITLTAYGFMAELAREAMEKLAFEHEIFCELVVPTQLSPFAQGGALNAQLSASLAQSGRLLAIEEGTFTLGWGAEVLARATAHGGLKAARRVAAAETPIPASRPLEDAALPGVEHIVAAAREMV